MYFLFYIFVNAILCSFFSYCIVIITIYIFLFLYTNCLLFQMQCIFLFFYAYYQLVYIYICIACVHKWSIQLIDAFHQVVGRREATCPQLKTMLFADFAATQNPVILDGYLYILGFIGNGYLYRIGCNNLF